MTIFDKVFNFIESLDSKKFIQYAAGVIAGLVALTGLISWQYYSTIHQLRRKIDNVNELREEVRTLRQNMLQVHNQRLAVNTMLAEEPDFKIAGYFSSLLDKLSLTDKKITEENTQTDREDNYRESELVASLAGINMKELTQLLYELEQKARIYIKKLDIEKSKKQPDALDVVINIATLLQKVE
jgi:hypothetical protein